MKKLRENYLDGEKLFLKYFEMGEATSIPRLVNYATSENMLSPEGKKPTPMGVWKAMWRWASLKENKDRAFEVFSHYVKNYGWRFPDTDLPWDSDDPRELWHQFMMKTIKSAWQFGTQSRLNRFLHKNGWI